MYVFFKLQIWLESFSYVMLTLMHICIRHDTLFTCHCSNGLIVVDPVM